MTRPVAAKRALPSRFATPDASPGFLLWQVTNAWQRAQRAALRRFKLTHVQFVVLAGVGWMTSTRGSVTQTALARHSRLDPMMTSQVVRRLAGRRLLTLREHVEDARAKAIRLTSAGRVLLEQTLPVVEHVDDEFFRGLGADSVTFTAQLRALAEAI